MPFILFESGSDKGRHIELKPGRVYAGGRDPETEVSINDELVAPVHFKIKEHKGKYFIRAMEKGTELLVNDDSVVQIELELNDKIQVGATYLSFVEEVRADFLIGQSLGGYEIHETLGRGGMGKVYRARQLSLNREVAIKMLSPRLRRDAKFRELFIREARAAGALNHPNVLQVYDVVEEGDLCFYSMEYITGGTVEDLINKGEVSLEQTLGIVRDAAQGLEYAEQKQIVHHDIKPQNLMITELGSIKISDMGLALSLEESSMGKGSGLIGTPHFISPERILKKEQDIRSDIYSLGCTFYMILTGKTPFHGNTVKEILRKQLKEEPTPVREVRSDVPETVERIIQRMMSKSPEDRHPSASDLLEDLQGLRLGKRSGALTVLAIAAVILIAAGIFYAVNRSNGEGEVESPGAVESGGPEDDGSEDREHALEEKLREVQASNAYLTIPEDAADQARLESLDAIVRDFKGTPTAEKAAAEAKAIRDRLAREEAARTAKAEAIKALMEESAPALQELLSTSSFGAALAFAHDIGRAQDLYDDPEVKDFRDGKVREAQDACLGYSETLLKEARDLLEKREFEGAREKIEEGKGVISAPAKAMDEQAAAFIQGINLKLTKQLTEVAKAERDFHLSLYEDDLELFLSSLSIPLVREGVLQYEFQKSEEVFSSLLSRLKTKSYQAHLEKLRAGPAAAAGLLVRFNETVKKGALLNDEVRGPGMDEKARAQITELMSDGKGVRVMITQGKRSRISDIAYSEFIEPAALIHLLDDRFSMTGKDKLDLAEAALHFAAARCAAHLAPLEAAVAQYDPDAGWTAERKKEAQVSPHLLEAGADILSLLDAAEAKDAALKERCDSLRKRVAEEEAAVELFYEGVDPFLSESPKIGFGEADAKLNEFARHYTSTIFFWYVHNLVGGSTLPGRHLVELTL